MDFIAGLCIALMGLAMVYMDSSPVIILMGALVSVFGAWIMIDETIEAGKSIWRDWPRKEGDQ